MGCNPSKKSRVEEDSQATSFSTSSPFSAPPYQWPFPNTPPRVITPPPPCHLPLSPAPPYQWPFPNTPPRVVTPSTKIHFHDSPRPYHPAIRLIPTRSKDLHLRNQHSDQDSGISHSSTQPRHTQIPYWKISAYDHPHQPTPYINLTPNRPHRSRVQGSRSSSEHARVRQPRHKHRQVSPCFLDYAVPCEPEIGSAAVTDSVWNSAASRKHVNKCTPCRESHPRQKFSCNYERRLRVSGERGGPYYTEDFVQGVEEWRERAAAVMERQPSFIT